MIHRQTRKHVPFSRWFTLLICALPALLAFEDSSVAVGETARLFVFTGLKAQEMVLEILADPVEPNLTDNQTGEVEELLIRAEEELRDLEVRRS